MGGFGSADPKASQRALLDQLMGAERDLDLESKARKKFWEKDVCKLYLAGLSPYKLLKETRGFVANGYDVWVKHAYAYALRLDCRPDDVDCERWKIDHNLKAQYDALDDETKARYGYERVLYDCVHSLVKQGDRRIANQKEKIEVKNVTITDDIVAKIAELDAAYRAKTEESETLGEVGEIEESMRAMGEADEIRKAKVDLETKCMGGEGTKRFVVCQTTGDLIEAAAAADDAWMASHFESADFQGWKVLRETCARLKLQRDGRGPARHAPGYELGRGGEAAERDRLREEGRARPPPPRAPPPARRDRDRPRSRSRDRGRDRRDDYRRDDYRRRDDGYDRRRDDDRGRDRVRRDDGYDRRRDDRDRDYDRRPTYRREPEPGEAPVYRRDAPPHYRRENREPEPGEA